MQWSLPRVVPGVHVCSDVKQTLDRLKAPQGSSRVHVAQPESWYQARFDERNSAALNLNRSQKHNRVRALASARKREAARRAEEADEAEEDDDFSVVISAVHDDKFDERGDEPPSGSAGSPIAV